ncbi:F-box protein At3g07870-like [Primulina huaijiensis]|uniref:F-box protein At3g07870-like n=1 Tax=Primulina huaijiensis TaxID=1492673 RepID=UPI003CC743AD
MEQSSHFTNLPLEIFTDIVSRLPVLHIARLKCVCKVWLELFESPEFSKLHLSKSSAGLLIYQHLGESCLLKIFGFEDEPEVERHELNYSPVTIFDITEFKCQTISGSVDGFLCLRVIGHIDNLYICNPFTREYITLPTLESYVHFPSIVTYGFGVSTIGCQYKVVRIFHESELDQTGVCVRIPRSDCHVYTLGTTGTWRSIAPSPPLYYNCYSIGAFVNGNLHWLAGDLNDSYLISCLDLDKEMFRTFSAPPLPGYNRCLGSLVVLGDCLSVCDNTSENDIVIWIMKDYDVGKSWTKEFVISKIPDLSGECYELVLPIKVFRNGDILMIWGDFHLFYYSNKTKIASKTDIVEMLPSGAVEAILHVPSFVSLTCFGMENVNSF